MVFPSPNFLQDPNYPRQERKEQLRSCLRTGKGTRGQAKKQRDREAGGRRTEEQGAGGQRNREQGAEGQKTERQGTGGQGNRGRR